MADLINPARIDFVTLRLFCAVAQAGSISKGAKACNLALSAASRRLSDFEDSAQSVFFDRGARGISLTPSGHVALQHALRLVHGYERFSSELREHAKGARGHVRLWANMSALTEVLPRALAAFAERHPDIRVEIEDESSGEVVRALVEGLADVGVFGENTPAFGLDVSEFHRDELVVLCAKAHPFARARRRAASFRACLEHDFVGLGRGTSLVELTSAAAARLGIPMRVRVQVRSFDTACRMIAENLGIGVLPLAACEPQVRSLGLHVVRLNEPWADRHLLLGTKSGASLSPAGVFLLAHLTEMTRAGP